jgi:C4-dicarboxylate-specific signal transduction histidine kinase
MDADGATASLRTSLRRWPLQRKVAALLVLAAGVPPLLVASLLLRDERKLRRDLNEAVLRARVDQVGGTLEARAQAYAGLVARYATDPDFIAFSESAGAARQRLQPGVQARLVSVLRADPSLQGTSIMDASGVVIASTDPVVGRRLAHRGYFRNALSGDLAPELFLGVPAVGRAPLVAFPAPIKSGGRLVGIYVALARAEAFWEVMRTANEGAAPDSYYTLFDRDGVRIGHSADASLLFRPAAPLSAEATRRMLDSQRFQERTAELLASPEPFPLEVLGVPGVTTFRRFSPVNHAWNLGVSRFFPSLGWTLVAMIPERHVEVRAIDIVPQAVPPTVIGLVLALVGGAILMRQIVNPIRKLAAAAAALERGAPVAPHLDIDAGVGDDVGALLSAFRSMAASLTERDRQLWAGFRDLRQVLDSVGQGFLAADPEGRLATVHSAVTETWFGPMRVGEPLWDYFGNCDPGYAGALRQSWPDLADAAQAADAPSTLPTSVQCADRAFEVAYQTVRSQGRLERVILVITDVTAVLAQQIAERQLEAELRQAQKLEAVGQIAAGVAHEINTPIQYIGDGTRFTKDSFSAVAEVLRLQQEALATAELPEETKERLRAAGEAADLGYVMEEVPKALVQVLDGVQRVSAIVRAMKEFAHPDQKEMVPTDLNRALGATLEISRNEYKYVADVDTDLGELPMVSCHAGDLNQVFLNIIVNAAHAIGDVVKGTSQKGQIRVKTRLEGDDVVVTISDTGGGIPWQLRDKVFEPFFTTKPVGKGTGQGLAIARSVVRNHGGQLSFDSEVGKGTVFTIRLPCRCGAPPERGAGDARERAP